MDYDGGFILQKDVNWSLLTEGLAIPTSVCSRFADWDASILEHGASKPVKILIDGEFYEATLKNQNFDQRRYPGHKDIIQIRYMPNSQLAVKLRSVFQESYAYLAAQRQLEENRHRQLVLPSDIRESYNFKAESKRFRPFLCSPHYIISSSSSVCEEIIQTFHQYVSLHL